MQTVVTASQTSQSFEQRLNAKSLSPLWTVLAEIVPAQAGSDAAPAIWKYEDTRPLLFEAGERISAEKAVRRVLILENPALAGAHAITRSLYAGLQLILPGEIAPCHRHAQSALRFVLEGTGAHTSINGERVPMAPFDLVLTPSGQWHDHGNTSGQPMVWLDGLDIPLLLTLGCGYAEDFEGGVHPPTRPAGATLMRAGTGSRPVRPSAADAASAAQPLFHYPYEVYRATLAHMAGHDSPDVCDGHRIEFINPRDGGSVMQTMSAFAQWLPKGFAGAARQSTDGAVYSICEGRGSALIGDEEFNFAPRDTFVVPPWRPLALRAEEEDTILFSFSDRAVQERLGLWREQRPA